MLRNMHRMVAAVATSDVDATLESQEPQGLQFRLFSYRFL